MFLDLLYPKRCLNCKKTGRYVCIDCVKLTPLAKSICPVCLRSSIDGVTHSKCQRPLSLDGLTVVWQYDKVIKKAVKFMKYKFASEIGEELSELALHVITKTYPIKTAQKVLLVPIPATRLRENWRGFNQSEIIGREIAQKMSWKYIPDLLIKSKHTRHQTKLKRKERFKNIRGAFSFNPSYPKLLSTTYQLLIFDDVWTTGSTLKEAAKVLKRKGFKKVWGLTIAR